MAGSFGFEQDKYDLSITIGEMELLPAVRQAPADWLIIADGFSCREQIAQGTPRRALHLAEVLHMALDAVPESHPIPSLPAPASAGGSISVDEACRIRPGSPCSRGNPVLQNVQKSLI